MGSRGWVRSNAWIWLFSSTHSTSARSGGCRYNPTMSRTFSMNSGSFDSLNVSVRCGCNAKARQMRFTVLRLNPDIFDPPLCVKMTETVSTPEITVEGETG